MRRGSGLPRPMLWRLGLIAALATGLAACATKPLPLPQVGPAPKRPSAPAHAPKPAPSPPPRVVLSWSQLPGWAEEDHLAALEAIRAACRVSKDPALAHACSRLRADPPIDEASARAFLEAGFRPEPVEGEGLLTAYFAPEYAAREAEEPPFTGPVRPAPKGLDALIATVMGADGAASAAPAESPPALEAPQALDPPATPEGADGSADVAGLADRLGPESSQASPPPAAASPPTPLPIPAEPDRAVIDTWPTGDALVWMKPEDLFLMQVQGAGVLDLPDGRRLKAAFAATNGQPFVGLAKVMREAGLIDDAHSSSDAIRAWLADHRGPEADAIMRKNPRYVFFKVMPDDGLGPKGAAGVSLPPGRATAVDPAFHKLGELLWIEAEAPALAGAFPRYRRLTAALDVGGAIKGPVRADLYMGQGADAGREAGRVRHRLTLYRLVPIPTPDAP